MPSSPILHSYWVIPGRLLAGEYPRNLDEPSSMEKLQALTDAGITVFIDLTTPADGLSPYRTLLQRINVTAECHWVPIPDVSVPQSAETTAQVLDLMDQAVAKGQGVYLHCWGGIGRTGTIVGCWLARHGLTGTMALEKLASLWRRCPKSRFRQSPETEEQRRYIVNWRETGQMLAENILTRARGCMLGQLAGDSLGSLVEFQTPDQIRQVYPHGVRELADGGTWNTLAGQPTDDSELALMLARSLVEHGRYDRYKVKAAYRAWYDSGLFDCGGTIASALRGMPNEDSQANGALMRVSPLGIFGAGHALWDVAKWAMQDAGLTHPHPVCRQANAIFAMALARTIRTGCAARSVYAGMLVWAEELDAEPGLRGALLQAALTLPQNYVKHQGWVLIALQNAVWQMLHAPSLADGVVDSVMHGGDTDTNAAICGALLGAIHGEAAIPAQWKEKVLHCRPEKGKPGVHRPRPEVFWPVDALGLAAGLISGPGQGDRP